MKKIILGLFLLAAAFTFAACNSTSGEQAVTFESDNQVFSIEALSAANLLDTSAINTLSYIPLSDVVTTEPVTTEPVTTEDTTSSDGEDIITDDQIDQVDQYIEMMNGFLGDNNGLSVQVLESDRAEYDNLISFTTVNLLGEEVVYYMYYNETLFNSETEPTTTEPTTTEPTTTEVPETTVAPETTVPETTDTTEATDLGLVQTAQGGDQERNFYFEDDDDFEVAYLLQGLIVANGLEYNVEGKRVVETNGDEILRLRSFIDKDNFVLVSYKLDAEDNTKKFFFKVVTDGELVSQSKVKVTEEDGSTKVMLSLSENGTDARYLFSLLEEDNVTYYHIIYNISNPDGTTERGNIHITATLDQTTGEIVYTYKVLQSENKVNHQYQYQYQTERKHNDRSQRDEHANTTHPNGKM